VLIRRLVASLCALSLLVQPVALASEDLPDIGNPADTVLSRDRELQIGRAIYKSLRDTGRVISDPEIQEYVQDVGQKLTAHAQDGGYRFHFFVVDDPTINAFALPGGYIGVHSGLLLTTANESELAGVLGHEIAHVTQRHISRAIFANQRMSILTMAAMLGAILIGAVAGGGGDAVQGAVAAAQGIQVQQQINFTRSNEYEADRVGVRTVSAAGFDPMGMPSFFETLARQTGPLASQAPEFLRTHPVTVNRIAETRQRAAKLPRTESVDSTGYGLACARLRVLTSSTPDAALAALRAEAQTPGGAGSLGIEYGIALARLELGQPREAREMFEVLLKANPEVIHFHTGLAAANLALGETDAAMSGYAKAMQLFPRNVPLTVRYAEALLQQGNPKMAHQILLDLLNTVPPTPGQARLIARAASAAGDTADAHYYMAEYHLLNGDLELAGDQLRMALSIPGLDNVQRARFNSRLAEVQEILIRLQSQRRAAEAERRQEPQ
jgi:predicted Zn-dependent protease